MNNYGTYTSTYTNIYLDYNIIPILSFNYFDQTDYLEKQVGIGTLGMYKSDTLHLVVRHRNTDNCETIFMYPKKIFMLQKKLMTSKYGVRSTWTHTHTQVHPQLTYSELGKHEV